MLALDVVLLAAVLWSKRRWLAAVALTISVPQLFVVFIVREPDFLLVALAIPLATCLASYRLLGPSSPPEKRTCSGLNGNLL